MAVQVVSLVNYVITLTNPAYVLKPFESHIFDISELTSELIAKDAAKVLQAEVMVSALSPVLYNRDTQTMSADGYSVSVSVSGAEISAAALASTIGTPSALYRLTDGPDAGAKLTWAIPSGSSTYTWCWWLWPQAAY